MAATSPHHQPNPNLHPDPDRNRNPELGDEVADPPAPRNYKGTRQRKSGGYAAEIRHRLIPKPSRRMWLGTYTTAEEAAFAYDLTLIRLEESPCNFPLGPTTTSINQARQDAIREFIEGKFRECTRNGADQEAETSNKRKWTRKSSGAQLKGKNGRAEKKNEAKREVGFL